MERVELGWDEFWGYLFRVRHRRSIPGIQHYDELVAEFCIEALGLKPGNEILDIACGAGDHSVLFAQKGLKVAGFDISSSLINSAKDHAEDKGVAVEFFKGDMREINFVQRFHGSVLLSHSFGFFNHEENMRVLQGSYNALCEGGKLLLDLMNPYNIPHFLDAHSGVLRGRPATYIDIENSRVVLMNQDALSNNDIRMYTALEINEFLKEVGFTKTELYGENKLPRRPYASGSERMVVVATK
jgi:ubiquinone/menaquinone biosynthesis C-methylase UbiE